MLEIKKMMCKQNENINNKRKPEKKPERYFKVKRTTEMENSLEGFKDRIKQKEWQTSRQDN